jgi:hypothetical protein
MYKNATKCNETIGKWCKTKHGASKIIDTFETYHTATVTAAKAAGYNGQVQLRASYRMVPF